jgi:glycosyltransferase involved in cell wall biosynthesis
MKTPIVSIIIPAYNKATFINDAIKSCLNQTYDECEIVIVDDGSTDGTIQVIKKFLPHPRVTLIETDNMGASSARNIGLMAARGEYIQYLDADDYLDADKLRRQIMQLRYQPPSTISVSRHYTHDVRSGKVQAYEDTFAGEVDPIRWIEDALQEKVAYPPSVYLLHRSIAESAGFWNTKLSYNDDAEYFIRVLLCCDKMLYCDESLVYYRIAVSGSLGSLRNRKSYISELDALKLVADRLTNHQELQSAVAYALGKYYFKTYMKHPDLSKKAYYMMKEINVDVDTNHYNGKARMLSKLITWRLVSRIRHVLGYK